MTRPVGVVPIGNVPEITPKAIAGNILSHLNLDADILTPLPNPVYAFDEARLQYDAGRIIKALESLPFHGYDKVIGVLDVDLFVPVFTHVFGEARQGGNSAVVSFYRLKTDKDGSISSLSVQLERAAKVALHELGHLFGLFHCSDKKCLMCFSGSLEDLDEMPLYFCRYCSLIFRDKLLRQELARK